MTEDDASRFSANMTTIEDTNSNELGGCEIAGCVCSSFDGPDGAQYCGSCGHTVGDHEVAELVEAELPACSECDCEGFLGDERARFCGACGHARESHSLAPAPEARASITQTEPEPTGGGASESGEPESADDRHQALVPAGLTRRFQSGRPSEVDSSVEVAELVAERLGLPHTRGSRKGLKKILDANHDVMIDIRDGLVDVFISTWHGAAKKFDAARVCFVLTAERVHVIDLRDTVGKSTSFARRGLKDVGYRSGHGYGEIQIVMPNGDRRTFPFSAPIPEDGPPNLTRALLDDTYSNEEQSDLIRTYPQRLANARLLIECNLIRFYQAAVEQSPIYVEDVEANETSVTVSWLFQQVNQWKELFAVTNTILGTLGDRSSGASFARRALEYNIATGAQRAFAGNAPDGFLTAPETKRATLTCEIHFVGWTYFATCKTTGPVEKSLADEVSEFINAELQGREWLINGPRFAIDAAGAFVEVPGGIEPSKRHRLVFDASMAGHRMHVMRVEEKAKTESGIKTCPQCAEDVKLAAMKCRYCGFEFE